MKIVPREVPTAKYSNCSPLQNTREVGYSPSFELSSCGCKDTDDRPSSLYVQTPLCSYPSSTIPLVHFQIFLK